MAELARGDGQEGRPVYVAFRGKVYDATNSRLWRGGKHVAAHASGADLTEAFVHAPHSEEVLARLPILGFLAKPETLRDRLLRRIDRLHPHATLVHLSFAYAVTAPFVFGGWVFTGQGIFDQVTRYLLALGLVSVPLTALTGIVSWMVSYETKAARVFNLKFALGVLLFLSIMWTFLWRLVGPEFVLSRPGCYFYLALLVVQLALALAADFFGKRIVYS
jgi:predicted heme/steroid binding protein